MPSKAEQLQDILGKMGSPIEDVQNVTGIIYGDNGTGKTITAIRLAQRILDWKGGGEILFLDAVNAWRSVKNHPDLQPRLKRLKYEGKSQLDIIIEAIQWQAPGFENIKVIILDEMSSMTDRDGDVVLEARSNADKSKDPDVLTQPDMGATTERMRRTVIKLLQQEISVIFVAHVRQDEDKNVGYKVTRPRFMPKFSGTIREGLDFVVHMSAGPAQNVNGQVTYERTVQSHPTTTVVAKTRVGGLQLKETPDNWIDGVIRWLEGKVGDDNTQVIVNDTPVDVSEEASEFAGVTVD